MKEMKGVNGRSSKRKATMKNKKAVKKKYPKTKYMYQARLLKPEEPNHSLTQDSRPKRRLLSTT